MESSLRPRDPNELNLHGEFANRRASPKKRRRREYRRKHSSVGRTHRRNPSSPQVEEHSSVSHRISIGDLISSLDHGFESYSAQLLLPFHSLLHESAFLDLDHRQMLQKDPFFASWHLSSSAANLWLAFWQGVRWLEGMVVMRSPLIDPSSNPNGAHLDGLLEVSRSRRTSRFELNKQLTVDPPAHGAISEEKEIPLITILLVSHMYRTNFGIGHSIKDLLEAHILEGGLALASLGVITSLVAQHMYSLPAYAFIAQDLTTRNEDNVLARMLDHKEAIISHLSWASLFLGFHTLGLYVHNDVMLAFGTPEKQILIEPIFAQWIQSAHGKTSYGFDVLLSSTNGPAFNAGRSIWLLGWLNAVNENSNSLFLTIGPGDFLVHHAIALGLHTTTLILGKGALDARGSKLMPDKKDFGYSFPCDGPGRGVVIFLLGTHFLWQFCGC
ncbi:hypothetical protein ZIOFF_074374 (mitochondrion) [Zingiber officinale]|uniref:Photosystem I chlorophyll a apoprotein A2 n=1 Tax=Zingiber officinale TaxID=94328 RepID=A0A8J5ENI9_ZINOF|nr:hypothetical protein ZIOFF_074374 [Zingiber officinale]